MAKIQDNCCCNTSNPISLCISNSIWISIWICNYY